MCKVTHSVVNFFIFIIFLKIIIECSKGTPEETLDGVESLFRLSSRASACCIADHCAHHAKNSVTSLDIYNHYITKENGNLQMDLSTLFSTMQSLTQLMLASIIIEICVLSLP